jgi:integrase/recombinase XerD
MATKYIRNGVWHIQYTTPAGKRIQKSTRIEAGDRETERLAEIARKEAEIRIAKGRMGLVDAEDASIMESARKWIATLESRKKSPRTVERYKENINNLLSWWAENHKDKRMLSDITTDNLETFVTARSKKVAPNTVRSEIQHLSAFFNWCVRMGSLKANPIRNVSKPEKVESHVRFFTRKDVKRIFAQCPAARRPLYEFLYRTGCRIGETARLRVGDVDFGRNRILLPAESTKAKRPDEIEIPVKLRRILKSLCAGKKATDLVFSDAPKWGARFNQIRVEFKKFCRWDLKPPIKDCCIHTWRHTAISHWVMAGVPLAIVQKLARHTDIKTTMHYAHLAPEAVRGEINRLPV